MRRLTTITAIGLALALGLAACGSDDASVPAATDLMPTVPTETAAPASGAADDPCSLVTGAELEDVFGGSAPEGNSNVMGAGFGECEWELGDMSVSVSVVPAGNLSSDFVEQLNVTGPVESDVLGDDAVSFPGTVGIGRAASGGATVGFTSGDVGILVAVNAGGDDLASATAIAEAIATRL